MPAPQTPAPDCPLSISAGLMTNRHFKLKRVQTELWSRHNLPHPLYAESSPLGYNNSVLPVLRPDCLEFTFTVPFPSHPYAGLVGLAFKTDLESNHVHHYLL